MKLTFTEAGWSDYLWFVQSNPGLLVRLNQVIRDALRDPFRGLGKPEPLKGSLSGCRSRRVNSEHRLVYQVKADALVVISCRFHYD